MNRLISLLACAFAVASCLAPAGALAGEPVLSLAFSANTIGTYKPCPS
ncbi:MAG: hypothetical protein HQK81_12115 [Desulfovibrionaceae bacterium]|nr:hypothetical protein [Desulfovibrionaceae bacterium]MBF0514788.1 hypothetical protein [Desulfovibrionaceae bacterium]